MSHKNILFIYNLFILFLTNPITYKYVTSISVLNYTEEKVFFIFLQSTLLFQTLCLKINIKNMFKETIIYFFGSIIISLLLFIFFLLIPPFSTFRYFVLFLIAFNLMMNNLNIFKNTKISLIKQNILLLWTSFFFCVIVLEIFLMNYPKSHGYNFKSLNSQLWFKKNWHKNSDGFRDIDPEDYDENDLIVFLGDSFTEGHGVKVEERYSNLVGKTISSKQMVNLGKSGSDTRAQFKTFKKFCSTNKNNISLLVYQYYGNDIVCTAEENGIKYNVESLKEKLSPENFFFLLLIEKSFLFNFLITNISDDPETFFVKYLEEVYGNRKIVDLHFEEINNIVQHSLSNSIPVVVLLFPLMLDFDKSREIYINKVSNFLRQKGLSYIDISKINFRNKSKIVNRHNHHPSSFVHKLVSEKLTEYIKENQF